MKFTPEQVIEMAREAGAVPTLKDYVGGAAGWFLSPEDITRLCTLAADSALEARYPAEHATHPTKEQAK